MAGPIFSIFPNPHWVIIDNFSKLPDGAAIYTYRSLDPSTFKPAFQDAAGTIPYGQPIVGFGNGTMPPIFWEFDPANPTDTYYIRVYDSDDVTTQNFLWDFNGISGASGGGGGTVVTAYNIENLVVNNILYRNIGNQAGTPSLPTSLTIAPSNNAGYVNDPNNAQVITNGPVGPDIIFAKNVTTNSDQINFTDFTPLGTNDLTGDVTPQLFINYQCTAPGAGETYKYVQFPICQGIQSLSQQTMSVRIWARCNSGNNILTLKLRQFFGSGGAPSADNFVTVNTINLTNAWAPYNVSVIAPDATGGIVGTCGNDALFLQVVYPLNAATNIDFIKPAVYLGVISPGIDFVSNDEVDSIVNSPRTGDIRTSLNSFLPGWAIMNDGTIANGNPAIVPPAAGFARNNVDTFPLFDLIWNTFQSNQTLAPIYDVAGNPVGYGANSVADFTTNHQISLTKEAGRVMAGVSGSHLIGTTSGSDTQVISASNLPSLVDGTITSVTLSLGGAGTPVQSIGNNAQPPTSTRFSLGSDTPMNIMQPTVFMNVFIKL